MFNDDIYVTLLLGIFSCWILHNLSLSPACLRALGVVFYTQKQTILRAFTSCIPDIADLVSFCSCLQNKVIFAKLPPGFESNRGKSQGNMVKISLRFKSCAEKTRGFQTEWFLSKYKNFIDSDSLICRLAWARIFKLLKSPRIDCKEPIPPGCEAWRAGTTTLYSYSVPSPHR
jgi:hypothetical protein